MGNRSLRVAALSVSLALVIACARLPDYAKPRMVQMGEIRSAPSNGFPYRQLTREDFRATSLPESVTAHGKNINAQATTTIRITPDSKFSITPRAFSDPMDYSGVIQHLAFEAAMIPEHSWWNPKIDPARTGYVLQHEQIHFAITEIAARKLTREAQEWASNFSVVKETPQLVASEIARQIKAMIHSAMEVNRKRHLKFDENTSLFYSPPWQDWWFETVVKELKQTESGARRR